MITKESSGGGWLYGGLLEPTWFFVCDRCHTTYKGDFLLDTKVVKKHINRRHFCPMCILKRRDPEDYKRMKAFRVKLRRDKLRALFPHDKCLFEEDDE